jgi:prepilin-type N-terminal cleavage/methylation domain-containing protein
LRQLLVIRVILAPPKSRPARRPLAARGFSLVEIMAVVAIISVLVVGASPSFLKLMRDRRVNRAAMHIVDFYRTGRTRAMGRGQPMLVHWDANGVLTNSEEGAPGLIELWEPKVTSTNFATTNTCLNMTWRDTSVTQRVDGVDFKNGYYTYTDAKFYVNMGGNPDPIVDVCFMPSGRSYLRVGTGAFAPMTGVSSFKVINSKTTLMRQVFIPANGVARIQL